MTSKSHLLAAVAFALAGAAFAVPSTTLAAKAPIYTAAFSKTALEGYDAVAFFTDKKPVQGDAAFSTVYKGATFQFANAANLAKFKANPAAYAPQYGGYCAWAISQGYTAKGSPQNWKIVDGKLYLNYNSDIQAKWSKDIPGYIRSANANWPTVLDK